jgi:hypothetical protein
MLLIYSSGVPSVVIAFTLVLTHAQPHHVLVMLINRHSHTLTMFWCDNAAHLSFPRTAFRTVLEVGSVTVFFSNIEFCRISSFRNCPSLQSAAVLLSFVFTVPVL